MKRSKITEEQLLHYGFVKDSNQGWFNFRSTICVNLNENILRLINDNYFLDYQMCKNLDFQRLTEFMAKLFRVTENNIE